MANIQGYYKGQPLYVGEDYGARIRQIDAQPSPSSTPQAPTQRAIGMEPDAGPGVDINALLSSTRSLQSQSSRSDPYGNFGGLLTQMMQAYQNIEKYPFAKQQFDAQDLQSNRVSAQTPANLIGASPGQQAAARGASSSAVNPTIQGASNAGQTFSSRLQSLGESINSARQFMADYENAKKAEQARLESQAANQVNLILQAGSSAVEAVLKDSPDIFKLAGYDPKTLQAILPALKAQEAAAKEKEKKYELVETDQGYYTFDPSTAGLTPATSGGAGSRATRNNNPGNIKSSSATSTYSGVVGYDPNPASDGGYFLKFDTPQSGYAAMGRLLMSEGYRNLPLDAAMRRWSGGGYGADVAPQFAGRTIGSLNNVELGQLTRLMSAREGFGGTSGGSGPMPPKDPATIKLEQEQAAEAEQKAQQNKVLAQKVDQINDVISSSGFGSAVGPNALARLSFSEVYSAKRTNAVAAIEQIVSKEFLDNLIAAKERGATFGALQKAEQDALTAAATKIGNWRIQEKDKNGNLYTIGYKTTEEAMRAELNRIKAIAEGASSRTIVGTTSTGLQYTIQ